jgi:hypothetical protein
MRYAQIAAGQKLHLVYEPGEGPDPQHLIAKGFVSNPLCGRAAPNGYRATINVPLANACGRCLRVYDARRQKEAGK